MNQHVAIVVKVKDRYYCGYNKKLDRIKTAWSLPGAILFADWDHSEVDKVIKTLLRKGYKPEKHIVEIVI